MSPRAPSETAERRPIKQAQTFTSLEAGWQSKLKMLVQASDEVVRVFVGHLPPVTKHWKEHGKGGNRSTPKTRNIGA